MKIKKTLIGLFVIVLLGAVVAWVLGVDLLRSADATCALMASPDQAALTPQGQAVCDQLHLSNMHPVALANADVTQLKDGGDYAVRIDFDGNAGMAQAVYEFPFPVTAAALSLKYRKTSKSRAYVEFRFEDASHSGDGGIVNVEIGSLKTWLPFLVTGVEEELYIPLYRGSVIPEESLGLVCMRGKPGAMFNPDGNMRLTVLAKDFEGTLSLELGNILLEGISPQEHISKGNFFPFVDKYGQYMHSDWPGKVHSDAQLREDATQDDTYLSSFDNSAESWDQYGGWEGGPQLDATGKFRTVKINGKWWLVDPDGRLFWSHGVAGVQLGSEVTPITDREHYFSELEDTNGAEFLKAGKWIGVPGYYKGYDTYMTYNFNAANLARKYGNAWYNHYIDMQGRRLSAWRLNTLGAFSYTDPFKIPSLSIVSSGKAPRIAGSKGHWRQFPDPYSAGFPEAIRESLNAYKPDAYRIGFFLDNEEHWGGEYELALAALKSPAPQPAKKHVVERLTDKYESIAKLNQAWQSDYSDWNALLGETEVPHFSAQVREDLRQINDDIIHQYFRVFREEIDRAFPGTLMFTARFAGVPHERILRIAAQYCDGFVFNLYVDSLLGLALPEGIDKPVIVGEFHFGALDSGLMHAGLVRTRNQLERAEAYTRFVQSGLNNPYVVGTHWFQYWDEPVAGRPDGENYQIGLVSVADRPYEELVKAVNGVGRRMYTERYGEAREE
ncbi:MAG: beta-agarase [Verrucomicrobiota bacterium JB024]|nr:beta-agarase [Verrucomicrobiota bacterium JB024]